MAEAWFDEMADHGWSQNGRRKNADVKKRHLCDVDAGEGYEYCTDVTAADDADALMIFTHGADRDGYWGGLLNTYNENNCFIELDEMYLGDTDTEFLHLSSCFSADDENLSRARRVFSDPNDGANGRLHQLTGFHGVMWIGEGWVGEYEDFADDAFDGPLAYAWVDNLYESDVKNNWDSCPVAMAVSRTAGDCLLRLTLERYNFIFPDPDAKSHWCAVAVEGCDPKGEDPFNF
jgi:hypothetical protein